MHLDTSGYIRMHLDTSGYIRMHQDTSGYIWIPIYFADFGCILMYPGVSARFFCLPFLPNLSMLPGMTGGWQLDVYRDIPVPIQGGPRHQL